MRVCAPLTPIYSASLALSQFGLINSLRTGNVVLDMLVCMLVPLLFGGIGQMFRELVPMCSRVRQHFKSRNQIERMILHTKRVNNWGYSFGTSTSDHLLIKVQPSLNPPINASASHPLCYIVAGNHALCFQAWPTDTQEGQLDAHI